MHIDQLGDKNDRWCILRTSGPRTIALAAALRDAGFDAWTPVRTSRRVVRAFSKARREHDAPIVPTFVFAKEGDLPGLAFATTDPRARLPAFSIFQHAGRIPLIGTAEMTGLREAEQEAQETLERQRKADADKEAHDGRVAAMRTKAAKRRAQRREYRDLAPGTHVVVADMPALVGVGGEVVSSTGTSAVVSFGGSLVMKIEAWRLATVEL